MGFFDGGFSGIASGIGGIASGISNYFTNKSNLDFAREQFDWQKYLASNQLQLRVADAKKAGLHPMAALGLGSTSFSPVSMSQSPYDFSWIGQMGQSADYAAAKAKDKEEQAEAVAISKENARLQNENLQLQNQGLQQDNEFKQWQMNAAMSGSTAQGLSGPANASVNGKNRSVVDGQDDSIVTGDTYGSGTAPLMRLSRHGNILVEHVDPDISDALTEDFIKNMQVKIGAEGQAVRLSPEAAKHFTKEERDAIARGDAELRRVPGVGWQFLWKSHMRPKYSKDRREVTGKIVF